MRPFLLLTFLAIAVSPQLLQARLGETYRECGLRYHGIIPDQSNTTRPLIPGAQHATFVFKGWHVRFAFINNCAAAAEYRKDLSHPDGPRILPAEVESILEAEKGKDGAWEIFKGNFTFSPSKAMQQLLVNSTSQRWKRTDGTTAETLVNLSVLLQTPAATQAIEAHKKQSAEAQKARIPKF